MDSPITFRTLREIRKKESSSPRLEKLDPNFYTLVKDYLARKQETSRDDSLRYARVIINDIINKRERKILDMAISAVRAGIPPENLLPEEEPLFKEAVKALRAFRERLGTAYSPWSETMPSTIMEEDTTPKKKEAPAPVEKGEPEKREQPEQEEQAEEQAREEKKPEHATKKRIILTEPVQEFMAEDGEIYGPYEEGEEAEIPERAAAILVESGKAEYA